MRFLRTIIWKEFKQIKADPIMIRLIIFPVFIQLFILGYAITTEVSHTTVTIVDYCNSPQSRSLSQTVVHSPLFDYVGPSPSETAAHTSLDNGTAKLALIIPHDFSRELNRGTKDARGQLLVDGQDAQSAGVAAGYMNAILAQWNKDVLKKKLEAKGLHIETMIPIVVQPVILFNPMLKSTWYMVPGLAVVLITMITALLTGLSIVKEKESGTLEQLMVTPLSPLHVVLGKVVPLIVIGLFELCVALVIAITWFGIPFKGNFFTLLVFALTYMVSSLGIGIFTSTIARTTQQVLFLTFFVLIFFLLLSGFFIPVENMPGWVQTITLVNPLRHFMEIIRSIFLKGSGFAELWQQGAALLGIGCTVFGASLLAFHRKVS